MHYRTPPLPTCLSVNSRVYKTSGRTGNAFKLYGVNKHRGKNIDKWRLRLYDIKYCVYKQSVPTVIVFMIRDAYTCKLRQNSCTYLCVIPYWPLLCSGAKLRDCMFMKQHVALEALFRCNDLLQIYGSVHVGVVFAAGRLWAVYLLFRQTGVDALFLRVLSCGCLKETWQGFICSMRTVLLPDGFCFVACRSHAHVTLRGTQLGCIS
jgi:hypothetical protein